MTKPFVPEPGAAIVRYQTADVDRALRFYTEPLGFHVVVRTGPVTTIARGALHVLLSAPESSGARPMPDGTRQGPGGWNRIVLYVRGSRRVDRHAERGRRPLPQRGGERAGRSTDPRRRSRREPDRAPRAAAPLMRGVSACSS
jgi:catechol 2,3-dioxygenase-like lactoylglutathione lyase family enzyme